MYVIYLFSEKGHEYIMYYSLNFIMSTKEPKPFHGVLCLKYKLCIGYHYYYFFCFWNDKIHFSSMKHKVPLWHIFFSVLLSKHPSIYPASQPTSHHCDWHYYESWSLPQQPKSEFGVIPWIFPLVHCRVTQNGNKSFIAKTNTTRKILQNNEIRSSLAVRGWLLLVEL